MKKYKGVVLGCGIIGTQYAADEERVFPRSHAESLMNNPCTELVGLVDTDSARLHEASLLFPQTQLYANAIEALETARPDIVVISTPPKTHSELAKLAADYGAKMIICEKPLAPDVKQAKALISSLQGKNVTLVLNFQRRFFTYFEKLRHDITQGALGDIQQITGYYDNGLYNTGAHIVDSILYLLNEQIVYASGLLNHKVTTHPPDDPDIDGILETSSGVRIALQGFNKGFYGLWELRIYGSKGVVILHEHGYSVEWRTPTRREKIPILSAYKHARKRESFVGGSLDEVIACHANGSVPRSGLKNGIEVLTVLDAIKESAYKNGERVIVNQHSEKLPQINPKELY